VVWDDGPGFEGDAARLFAPWFTTKPRGTGLGLAITQRIVRAHGWTIDAERAGARTRFVVAIPPSDVLFAERRGTGDAGVALTSASGEGDHENSHHR
jgi:nitrogen-specific signal transduction histidine kinase